MSYPAGTKLIVVWTHCEHGSAFRLGDILTSTGKTVLDDGTGLRAQEVEDKCEQRMVVDCICRHGATHCWPLAWLRPLEDPDTQPIETEEEIIA